MKSLSLCLLGVLLATSAFGKISQVVVYPNGAEITKVGTTTNDAGESLVTLETLANFEPSSLTVKLESPEADVQLLEIVTVPNLVTRPTNSLTALQEQVKTASQLVESLTQQKSLLQKYHEGIVNPEKLKTTTFEVWNKDFQDSFKALDAVVVSLATASQHLEDLRAQLSLKEAQNGQGTYIDGTLVKARMRAAKAGVLNYTLRYWVNEASWRPDYKLDAATKGALALEYNGIVQQSTGEAWDKVNLSLSTAKPVHDLVLPELVPTYLQIYAPQMFNRSLSGSMAVADFTSVGGADGVANAPAQKGYAVQREAARVATTTLALDYAIADPVSIQSDNQSHQVPIANAELKAHTYYVVYPDYTLSAFFQADVTNQTAVQYLPGPCSIFLDGEFMGNSQFSAAPGEAVSLGLGVDSRVKVKLDQKPEYKEKNLIGTTLTRTKESSVTIQNLTPFRQEIKVSRAIPVARNEKIEVTQVLPEAKADERGILNVTLTLEPNKKATLPLKYTISQPVSAQVMETR